MILLASPLIYFKVTNCWFGLDITDLVFSLFGIAIVVVSGWIGWQNNWIFVCVCGAIISIVGIRVSGQYFDGFMLLLCILIIVNNFRRNIVFIALSRSKLILLYSFILVFGNYLCIALKVTRTIVERKPGNNQNIKSYNVVFFWRPSVWFD